MTSTRVERVAPLKYSALFKGLDNLHRNEARKSHEDKTVYIAYGLVDGFSIEVSTSKCLAGLWFGDDLQASTWLHEWLATPFGIATMFVVSCALMGAAVCGNAGDDTEKDIYKTYNVELCPNGQRPLDEDILDNTLYLYHQNDQIFAVAKSKTKTIESFPIDEQYLAQHAASIKSRIAQSSLLTAEEKETIFNATTHRNFIRFKHFLITYWAYWRDAIKGVKNTVKGYQSAIAVADLFSLGSDLQQYVVPASLGLGVILAVNRILIRQMRNGVGGRKDKMDGNTAYLKLLKEELCDIYLLPALPEKIDPLYWQSYVMVKNDDGISFYYIEQDGVAEKIEIKPELMGDFERHGLSLMGNATNRRLKYEDIRLLMGHGGATHDRWKSFYVYLKDELRQQANFTHQKWLWAAGLGGLIDSLYLYVGIASISPLSGPILAAVLCASALFTAACIISRVYEEYDYQRLLRITQMKLAHEILRQELCAILAKNSINNDDLTKLGDEAQAKMDEILAITKKLYAENTFSSLYLAMLFGLKNGLVAYNAVACATFALGMLGSILAFSIPSWLIVASTLTGVICLIAGVLQAYQTYCAARPLLKPDELMHCTLETRASAPNEKEVLEDERLYLYTTDEGLIFAVVKNKDGVQESLYLNDNIAATDLAKLVNSLKKGIDLSSEQIAQVFHATEKYGYTARWTWDNLYATVKLEDALEHRPFTKSHCSIAGALQNETRQQPTEVDIQASIFSGMVVDAEPQVFFQEYCEMGRSCSSGGRQLIKCLEFLCIPFGISDTARASSLYKTISMVMFLGGAFILTWRAHTRGFGKPKPGAEDNVASANDPTVLLPSAVVDQPTVSSDAVLSEAPPLSPRVVNSESEHVIFNRPAAASEVTAVVKSHKKEETKKPTQDRSFFNRHHFFGASDLPKRNLGPNPASMSAPPAFSRTSSAPCLSSGSHSFQ